MKKLILHSLLLSACFTLITSCSKDVKTPAAQKVSNAYASKTGGSTTTTTSTTQTTTSGGHTCGGSTYGNGSSNGGY